MLAWGSIYFWTPVGHTFPDHPVLVSLPYSEVQHSVFLYGCHVSEICELKLMQGDFHPIEHFLVLSCIAVWAVV